jgi:hypothetical protein
MSKWQRAWFCVECKSELTWSQKMSNNGCCPLCGHLSDGSVCETVTRASEVSTAWTITKLKWVRVLLKPILRLHIWLELRKRGQ